MSYFSYLRTFVYVYRTGSYGNAAEALNMTTPTVSKHITSLEQQVGKSLFRRDPKDKNGGKSYKPTAFARDFAKDLAPHVDKIETLFDTSRAGTDKSGSTIYLGGLLEFIEMFLTPTITDLIPENIRFVVEADDAAEWVSLLEDQSLDMALIPSQSLSDHVGFKEFLSDEICMVAHKDLMKDDHNPEAFLKHPYISYSKHMPCIREFISNLWPGMDTLQSKSRLENFRMIKSMLMNKTGFSIVPKMIVEDELKSGELIKADTDFEKIYMRLYLVWNKFSMRKQKNIQVRDAILKAAE